MDHFHPPLYPQRQWHSFHHAWAAVLAADLNERLPEFCYAEPNIQFGIEIDVATWDQGGAQLGQSTYEAPSPDRELNFSVMTDSIEVQIFQPERRARLAAAIELVSPANKDRPAQRDAFVAKCRYYLQQEIALIIVDVVTDRTANLHEALLHSFGLECPPAERAKLYATAYRALPQGEEGDAKLAIWHRPLEIGAALPTLPLWVWDDCAIAVELDSTYQRTCHDIRIPMAS